MTLLGDFVQRTSPLEDHASVRPSMCLAFASLLRGVTGQLCAPSGSLRVESTMLESDSASKSLLHVPMTQEMWGESWGDSLPMIRPRHPQVTDHMVLSLPNRRTRVERL